MHKQMSLFSTDDDPVDNILKFAVRSFSDAESRWQQRRETGLSDEELAAAIAHEFGTLAGGALDGMYYELRGGKNPTLSYVHLSCEDAKRKRISGKQLLNKVRELKSVPYL